MLRISTPAIVLALANAATDALGKNKASHTKHNVTDTGKSVFWIASFGLFTTPRGDRSVVAKAAPLHSVNDGTYPRPACT